ncbi:MAG: hypothetical protein LBI09_00740 [Nitrososphaerota archaeon]|jgi:hypothetical protein|nr:hypothetical protein [Nitrososphaerota archaeon]
MPTRKIRVELSENGGGRWAITFEGQIPRDKLLQILNCVDLLDDIPNGGQSISNTTNTLPNTTSCFEKVQMTVQKNFPLIWFTSKDVQTIYEQTLNESISLSTASTYLARMTKKGLLIRIGSGNNVKYKVTPNTLQTAIKQQIKNKN